MKALRIIEPRRAEISDILSPQPLAGEVLLRVERVGFCGSDLNSFRGLNPLVTYPRIPGHEIAATVLSGPRNSSDHIPRAGEAVLVFPYTSCGVCAACRMGRSNCCRNNQTLGVQRDGGFCETMAIPAEKIIAAPGLTQAEMALVEPLSIGFHAAARGGFSPADTVAVLGCGAIGLGSIAGTARRGARVIAVDVDDVKLETARKAGALDTINSARVNLHDALKNLTEGEGPSGVIEAVGTPKTFRAAVDEVSYAGRVVYIGYVKEPVSYETKLFVQKELGIYGSRNATREEFVEVISMLRDKTFPVNEMVTRTVSLSEAARALEDWSNRPSQITKIHVILNSR